MVRHTLKRQTLKKFAAKFLVYLTILGVYASKDFKVQFLSKYCSAQYSSVVHVIINLSLITFLVKHCYGFGVRTGRVLQISIVLALNIMGLCFSQTLPKIIVIRMPIRGKNIN